MNVNAKAVLAVLWQCPKCSGCNVTPIDVANTKCEFCHEHIRVTRITYQNGAVVERETHDETRNAKS